MYSFTHVAGRYSTPNSHVSRGLSHSFSASQLRHSPRSTEISEQRSPSTSQLHHQHASPSTTSCRMSQSQLFATTPPKESASSPRATPNPRGIVHHANLSPTTTHLHARRSSSLAALPHALPPLTAPSSSPLPVSADLPLLAANAILAAKASQPQPFYGPHLLHGVHLLPVPSALLSLAKVTRMHMYHVSCTCTWTCPPSAIGAPLSGQGHSTHVHACTTCTCGICAYMHAHVHHGICACTCACGIRACVYAMPLGCTRHVHARASHASPACCTCWCSSCARAWPHCPGDEHV